MIQVEFTPGEPVPAILADTLVPGKNVVPAETDPALGNPVVGQKQDHPGNFDYSVHQPDGLVVPLDGDLTPAFVIKGLVLGVHRFGNARIEQAESPLDRGHVDGQVRFVED